MRRGNTHHHATPQVQSASTAEGLNRMIDLYMENVASPGSQLELEIRFGTMGFRTLTHNDHANVIDRLLSAGYRPIGTGDYHLRIHYENAGANASKHAMSNNRFEIDGMAQIQKYCTTNELDTDISYGPNRARCTRKMDAFVNGAPVRPVKFKDFNFKVSLQRETGLHMESAEIGRVIRAWPQTKKSFRYMKRTSFEHPESPIRFDISVVKESKRLPPPNSWMMETTYTFDQADVINSPPKYEIEIEIDNRRVGPGKFVDTPKALAFLVRRAIKVVLSGLQGTNFPVPYSEIQAVSNSYHQLLYRNHDKRQRHDPEGGAGRRPDDSESSSSSSSSSTSSSSDSGSDDDGNEKRGPQRKQGTQGNQERDKDNDKDKDKDKKNVRLTTKDFIGPSSVTLQRVNVSSKYDRDRHDRETSVPNIRHNYTVTDKADGQRKLLFVNGTGRMYLIDTAMNVQFTGLVCRDDKLYWSLLDGEHILHGKNGDYINMYAAFDIYFIRKIDIRHLALAFQHDDYANTNTTNFRLHYLTTFMMDTANAFQSVEPGAGAPMRIVPKRFRVAGKHNPNEIFECCTDILNQIQDGGFVYNTDGLIFTPADTGVGMFRAGGRPQMHRFTWPLSFKWKPVSHNTIDFLVTTDKNDDQSDTIYQKPNPVTCSDAPVIKYKTLTLRVGYTDRDGCANPLHTVLDGVSKVAANSRMALPDEPPKAAVPFFPTTPYDPSAHICNVALHNVNGIYQMRTESGDGFTDKSVVEFRYDKTREPGMRWIPIKVRHDKTLARETGNAFRVANDNWYSIHYPVEERMLRADAAGTATSPIDETSEEYETGIYYQRNRTDAAHGRGTKRATTTAATGVSGATGATATSAAGSGLVDISSTQPMRDFHNKFVKRTLISAVAKPGKTLIDFACGKGGDISKWIDAGLRFVFGIDVSEDNITNHYDGAYARYITYAKCHVDAVTYDGERKIPYAVFSKGDCGAVIRTAANTATAGQQGQQQHQRQDQESDARSLGVDVHQAIKQTVFGERPHDAKLIGKELSTYYGIGREGFDVSSIQFGLHYFWKDVKTLHTFMRNVSECTKVGGHFIGTCYDGRRVFDMLKQYNTRIPLRFEDEKGRIILSILKRYAKDAYFDDETCLGYAIDVFGESINATHTEYLVNMVYLERIMRNYGFELVPQADAQRDLMLPNGMGSFAELFDMMTQYYEYFEPSIAYFPKDAGRAAESPLEGVLPREVALAKRKRDKEIALKNREYEKRLKSQSALGVDNRRAAGDASDDDDDDDDDDYEDDAGAARGKGRGPRVTYTTGYGAYNNALPINANSDVLYYNPRGKAAEMNDTLKTMSFLNNYFVFRKIQHVDAQSVSDAFIKNDGMIMMDQAQQEQQEQHHQSQTQQEQQQQQQPKDKASGSQRVKKQIDGVIYVMDAMTGELYKPGHLKTCIGVLIVSANGKKKEIEFTNDDYAAQHKLQKEKTAKKHKDDVPKEDAPKETGDEGNGDEPEKEKKKRPKKMDKKEKE